jgi:hypothetical protein
MSSEAAIEVGPTAGALYSEASFFRAIHGGREYYRHRGTIPVEDGRFTAGSQQRPANRGGGHYQQGMSETEFNPYSPIAYRRFGSWGQAPRSLAYGFRAVRTASSRITGELRVVQMPSRVRQRLVTVQSRVERVLFIGNSLTFANDLPRMVQEVANDVAGLRVSCESVAFPNFSLEDHWADGRAQQKLMSGHWTLVVMQQGPSAGAEGRTVLRKYGKRFAAVATARGARVAMYTVWPSRARYGDMVRVIESHALAAQDAGGSVVPVGHAWRTALQHDPALPLYDGDGFHPSRTGTYLAALVFREWLTGQASGGFTSSWPGARKLRLNAAQSAILERAAHEAVAGPQ